MVRKSPWLAQVTGHHTGKLPTPELQNMIGIERGKVLAVEFVMGCLPADAEMF